FGEDGCGEPAERRALLARWERRAGNDRRREQCVQELVASAQPDRPSLVIDCRHSPARAALTRILRLVALVELVLLRWKQESPLVRSRAPVHGRKIERGCAVVLETADRLAIVHQLVVGHRVPAEVPPPRGPRLALVVLEEPREQLAPVALSRPLKEHVTEPR